MKKRILFFSIFTIILSICFINVFSSICFADSTPDLVTKIEDAFKTITTWMFKVATPAAAVAVCTGVFMQKFSFGEEERIRTGKKIVRTSLFSYAFLILLNFILEAIKLLLV